MWYGLQRSYVCLPEFHPQSSVFPGYPKLFSVTSKIGSPKLAKYKYAPNVFDDFENLFEIEMEAKQRDDGI